MTKPTDHEVHVEVTIRVVPSDPNRPIQEETVALLATQEEYDAGIYGISDSVGASATHLLRRMNGTGV